jgi:acyl-coenzyme A synthetase/AMP-(fatty) acid ligase
MNSLPLLPDAVADSAVAYRNGHQVSRKALLGDVLALANRLPQTGHVLNVCKDRYWFSLALLAAISKGISTHLPSSAAPECISGLCAELPGVVCLGDQAPQHSTNVPYFRVSDGESGRNSAELPIPMVGFDQPVVTAFTSGSTGRPQPHRKTFGRLLRDASAGAAIMWDAAGGPCSVVGTVPSQHMYGLESTVLLPIFGGGHMSPRVPFFPTDIANALDEMPAPRLLVTTPFHLRKLLDAGIRIPSLATVVCSTATLPPALAEEAEDRLGAPLVEIYGSTETGQLAHRRPTSQLEWETYAGITLTAKEGRTVAEGGHLEQPHALNDTVEILGPTRFRLIGRDSDLINIAGKRSSLGYLNHILTSVPGVQDGAFCLPASNEIGDVSRLAAFVVAPRLTAKEILAALRAHIDPVFLPRPIIFVDLLPRNETGKIPATALAELIAQHLPQRPSGPVGAA